MSRGLGRIERKVIKEMEERKDRKNPFFFSDMVYYVFDELCDEVGDIVKYYNRSQYVTVHRAVKSLEKKGIIQTIRNQHDHFSRREIKHGGESCYLTLTLNVDSIAQTLCNQHLSEEDIRK